MTENRFSLQPGSGTRDHPSPSRADDVRDTDSERRDGVYSEPIESASESDGSNDDVDVSNPQHRRKRARTVTGLTHASGSVRDLNISSRRRALPVTRAQRRVLVGGGASGDSEPVATRSSRMHSTSESSAGIRRVGVRVVTGNRRGLEGGTSTQVPLAMAVALAGLQKPCTCQGLGRVTRTGDQGLAGDASAASGLGPSDSRTTGPIPYYLSLADAESVEAEEALLQLTGIELPELCRSRARRHVS